MPKAVVIGASLAGLLAARALAEHFEAVTIVERDVLPSDAAYRAGVPQSRHLHALLARGQRVLERLFPGLRDDLLQCGAEDVDWPGDILWLSTVGWARRFTPGLGLLFASRELIEWRIRDRVLSRANVAVSEGCEAVGLVRDGESRIAGVRVRSRGTASSESALEADLVIDASGRDSRAPQWLEALGYAAPEETTVNAFLGYASRYYRRPPAARDWKAIVIGTTVDLPRGGAIFPVEGDRWLVTLAGMGGEYPPTDDRAFLEFARSLRSRILFDAIASAEPLGRIHGYRRTENQLRHYERIPLPPRLVVAGDAVASFNPIYGQGMTVSALAALELDRMLRGAVALDVLGPRFARRLAAIVAAPWVLATSEDFRYPTTTGGRPPLRVRLMHGYVLRLQQLTTRDPVILRAFLDVAHLVRSPAVLFSPAIVARALAGSRARGLSAPPTETPPAEALASTMTRPGA